ncbi:hypothetical protein Dimus_038591 [Dionaea muscipula]
MHVASLAALWATLLERLCSFNRRSLCLPRRTTLGSATAVSLPARLGDIVTGPPGCRACKIWFMPSKNISVSCLNSARVTGSSSPGLGWGSAFVAMPPTSCASLPSPSEGLSECWFSEG